MQRYECLCCNFVGDRNEFISETIIDLEPYGDRRVARETFILYCPECNSDETEEI